jgi:hypothetical protein
LGRERASHRRPGKSASYLAESDGPPSRPPSARVKAYLLRRGKYAKAAIRGNVQPRAGRGTQDLGTTERGAWPRGAPSTSRLHNSRVCCCIIVLGTSLPS